MMENNQNQGNQRFADQQHSTGHTSNRGFASMSPEQQRAIASKGGQAAHKQGVAHEWTSDEARAAGRKGGLATHRTSAKTHTTAEKQNIPNRDELLNESREILNNESWRRDTDHTPRNDNR